MMAFKPVLLWTDLLLWLLLAGVAVYAWRVRRREHLLQPWRRLLRSRSGVAAAVVLLAFIAVGVLDSLHLRLPLEKQGNGSGVHYSPEVLSVFDLLAGPLRKQVEKTYSAPFAARLYAKETIELPG
ncbi:MAG: ABC transporter permease, partial [Betaproteobacteria bacterium]